MRISPDIVLPDAEAAAKLLLHGGILLYPTETFYAIGCMADNSAAIGAIARIKKRDPEKPMPLIAATLEQADMAVNTSWAPANLLSMFWPGPLTVLLPAREQIPAILRNQKDMTAMRVSSHPLAGILASSCQFPITASSANISGEKPVDSWRDLDPKLIARCEAEHMEYGILPGKELSATLPSTLVEIPFSKSQQMRIVRAGAVSRAKLSSYGFVILD